MLAGRLDGADEIACEAFPLEFRGNGLVEDELGAVLDLFDVDFVGDDLFIEFRELFASVG